MVRGAGSKYLGTAGPYWAEQQGWGRRGKGGNGMERGVPVRGECGGWGGGEVKRMEGQIIYLFMNIEQR